MRAVDIIRKKRDGLSLTAEEIAAFVHGATSGDWPAYQVSALLMAIVLKGMDDGETAELTRAMVYSGARLDRPGLDTLRDAAEAGRIEAVWCLSPDRLARSFAYQMLILDELSRRLLEKEVVEGEELRALVGPVPPKAPDGTVPVVIPDPGPRAD